MSKTSIALLLMFFIAFATLITLNTMYASIPVLPSFPKIFPTEAVVSENTLSISPNPLIVQPGKTTAIQVLVDTKGIKPSLIQMELSYDPSALSHVSIVPGTFYQNPDVRLNMINGRNGRISYALAPSKGQEDQTASNIVATLRITPRLTAVTRETSISFMPKTVVQTDDSQNALKAALGTKILLRSSDIPTASPSAILPETPNLLPTAF